MAHETGQTHKTPTAFHVRGIASTSDRHMTNGFDLETDMMWQRIGDVVAAPRAAAPLLYSPAAALRNPTGGGAALPVRHLSDCERDRHRHRAGDVSRDGRRGTELEGSGKDARGAGGSPSSRAAGRGRSCIAARSRTRARMTLALNLAVERRERGAGAGRGDASGAARARPAAPPRRRPARRRRVRSYFLFKDKTSSFDAIGVFIIRRSLHIDLKVSRRPGRDQVSLKKRMQAVGGDGRHLRRYRLM
ncbi:hypothetical protein EVAR_74827_1 [Eumeta japonica]|uniref:Uncharacterized protein n=1 Tax=Eumeta variegata TaxID=151549 RepID=A0A4C1SQ90_EUMVA|nr:hypothetical protein EVAR_74827_1 [Eumeta japonica]